MKVELATLADFASVTREGKLNILGIFQEINPTSLPFSLPQMFLVIVYSASPAEAEAKKKMEVVLLDADSNPILKLTKEITVTKPKRPGTKSIVNQVVGLAGLRFAKSGDYQFSVMIDGDEKYSISLRVNEPSQRQLEEE